MENTPAAQKDKKYKTGATTKHTLFRTKIFVQTYALLFGTLILLLAGSFFAWEYAKSVYGANAQSALLGILSVSVSMLVVVLLYRLITSFGKIFRTAESVVDVLKQSKERYALAVSGASEGLWDWDIQSGKVYFSPYWKRMLGYGEEDTIDTIEFWKNSIHTDDRAAVQEALEEHFARRAAYYNARYRIKTKSGSYIWVYDKGHAVWNDNGEALRLAGSTRDISNIKNVEDVLKSRTDELEHTRGKLSKEIQNSRKFQQAVESATDAISIMTPEGEIVYVNPAWENLTGYDFSDVKGKNFAFLYSDDTENKIMLDMLESVKKGVLFVSEEMVARRRSSDTYQASISLFPIKEGGKIIFYTAIQQDITKRKEVDKAKTEFVSLASHQLRTPLSAIRWYSEMLLSGSAGNMDDVQERYLREIYNANKRMIELVSALLNVSRIDLGTFDISPELTDLTKIPQDIFKELDPQIKEKNLSIIANYDKDLPRVNVDPKLIRMVFQNLITNAIKYTKEKGVITVTIRRKDPNILFSVADNGMGIPEDQKDKIFSKLFRADNAREMDPAGTGLGLYIVKAIMEKSGGSIRFESTEGGGTTFYGIIPLSGSPKRGGSKKLD